MRLQMKPGGTFRALAVSCLLTGLFCSAAPLVAAEPAQRNVLLLVADDLGLDTGCYGNTKIKTPNIDALSANGVRFSHAFATVSSCSPSRASLYTGLHTHTSGQYGLAHPPHNFQTNGNVKSLPLQLHEAGYRTGILGKLHVLPKAVYPFDLDVQTGIGRNVLELARRAKEFFTEKSDKPFFLIIGYTDTHRTGKGFGNDHKLKDIPAVKYDPKDVKLPYFLPDQPEVREELAEYYQSASRLDHGIGLMMQALKDAGKSESTLVIFVSDNGIPFPGAKTTLYDAGLHLPLLISAPTQKKRGLVNKALASFVDVTPTVLDWAGLKPAQPLPGRSLLPILEEENPKGWDTVFGSHQHHQITLYYPMRMIRTREHKYILNLAHKLDYSLPSDLEGSSTWQGILKRGDKMLGQRTIESFLHRSREELFDLKKDPNELKNVAGDADYAKTLDDLRSRLKDWQKQTKDPWAGL